MDKKWLGIFALYSILLDLDYFSYFTTWIFKLKNKGFLLYCRKIGHGTVHRFLKINHRKLSNHQVVINMYIPTRLVVLFCRPRNVSEVRNFLGLVNYYEPTFSCSRSLFYIHSLNCCTKTSKFQGSPECEKSFPCINKEIASDKLFVTFWPLVPNNPDHRCQPSCIL